MPYRRSRLASLAGAFAMTLLVVSAAGAGGRPLTADMTGANEFPGPGDPDGTGFARITLNQGQGEVCWFIEVENITLPATAAHIHPGVAGTAGSPIVNLGAPGADGTSIGCTEDVDPALIKDIRQNPENYYVNVHTLPGFGPGAVRGQLSK
jgi:hypothetical protein